MNKFTILFVFFAFSLNAQVLDTNLPQVEKVYYWFSMKLGKTYDKVTDMNQVYVKNIDNEVESGTFQEYIAGHDRGLKSGKIVIGPFYEKHQAETSQWLYKYAGKDAPGSNQEEDESVYTFFYVKPMSEDSVQEINFERIPSRVTTGTQSEFMAMLGEGLGFDRLAIGPFFNYELAERSKFVYRKNDKISAANPSDPEKSKNLKIMAKKWKLLKMKIVKQADNKKLKKTTYRFSTEFPKNYFVPDAFQVFTITANYSESFNTSTSSFTLQGDVVDDNNQVIASNMSTVYINILHFDTNAPSKIKGFFFESFIYNDNEIIELEPVYIPMK